MVSSIGEHARNEASGVRQVAMPSEHGERDEYSTLSVAWHRLAGADRRSRGR
jgi:hypothetical protein